MIRDAPEPEGPEPEELKPENQKPEKTERTGSAAKWHSRFFSRKEGEPMPYGIPERAGDGPMAFLEPHLQMVKEEKSLYGLGPLSGPWQAAELVRPLFYGSDREMVAVLSLDARNRPAAAETVAVGGLDSVAVDVRNLFKHALLNNAKGIMIFHNHPSGDAEPSGEDRALYQPGPPGRGDPGDFPGGPHYPGGRLLLQLTGREPPGRYRRRGGGGNAAYKGDYLYHFWKVAGRAVHPAGPARDGPEERDRKRHGGTAEIIL